MATLAGGLRVRAQDPVQPPPVTTRAVPAAAPPRGHWRGRPLAPSVRDRVLAFQGLRLRCPHVESDHSSGRIVRGAYELLLTAPDVRVGSVVRGVERKDLKT